MANPLKKLEAELETVKAEKELSEQKFERLKCVLDKERQALFEVTAAARKTMEEQHRKKVELEDRLKLEREQRTVAEEAKDRHQQNLDTAVTRAVVAEGRHSQQPRAAVKGIVQVAAIFPRVALHETRAFNRAGASGWLSRHRQTPTAVNWLVLGLRLTVLCPGFVRVAVRWGWSRMRCRCLEV